MPRQDPSASKRLFGPETGQIESPLEKVRERFAPHIEQNPVSNRGPKAAMPLADRLLPTPGYPK